MKLFLFSFLISCSAMAQFEVAPDRYIDLMPLELQYRFEDSTNQERTNRQYQSYGLAMQFSVFRGEFEFNQFYDNTGNASYKIEQSIREYDLGLGYRVYQLTSDDRRLTLNAFAKLWYGQTRTKVETTLLSARTTTNSDPETVLGAGGSLLLRISYFMLETEFKYLNSQNMSPQSVPVFGVKIGVSLPY